MNDLPVLRPTTGVLLQAQCVQVVTTPAAACRWSTPKLALDPLALLLRSRYASRAELARASGLSYQTLRTYTDGLWKAQKPPSPFVMAMLGNAVDPDELTEAVDASLQARPAPPLSVGQRAVLEAVSGFDDRLHLGAAPLIHELLRDFPHDE